MVSHVILKFKCDTKIFFTYCAFVLEHLRPRIQNTCYVYIYQLILHHPFQVQKCGSIQGCTVRSRMKYALVLDFDFDYKINTYIADNKNVPEYFFD